LNGRFGNKFGLNWSMTTIPLADFKIYVKCSGENSIKKYPETIGKEGTRFEKKRCRQLFNFN